MTITVVGNITRDTLIFPDQNWKIVNGLGGTMYTVITLASLTNQEIRLVCNVGDDIIGTVTELLGKFPNIHLSGIKEFKGNHFHCYILFASPYGTQFDEGLEIPASYTQVKPFMKDSDFILVSPMTGFDLSLHSLKRMRTTSNCPIYFDYHILSLQRDAMGNRYLKRRKNWIEWCTGCDHLQMNQFEAESLALFPIKSENDIMSFAKPILSRGVVSVAVTLGESGALICWQHPNKKIYSAKLNVNYGGEVVDATGCGDVFAASFIVRYMKTRDIFESYQFANELAGEKCGFSGFDGFAELRRKYD
ncbi:MAG: PfkB family carbohydrate kinase [Chloroflexi bacterium]|nr:PfkB family carbohydrate kinase [Chloroflexota bacterium]